MRRPRRVSTTMVTGHIDPRYGDATATAPDWETSNAGSPTPSSTGW